MKYLTGVGLGRIREDDGRFECDKITLELDHGRTLTITRGTVHGEDGIMLQAGIDRPNQMVNGRIVIRPINFGCLQLNIEQAK